MTFAGFPDATFRFLRAIRRDNSYETLAAQRASYDEHVLGAARAFIGAVEARLRRLAPDLAIDPRVDGSISRLHRDARFVGEGPPLREHLEILFFEGERRAAVSVLSLRVAPGGARIGAGARALRGAHLSGYRAALAEPERRAELERCARALERRGFELSGEDLASVPRESRELELAPESLGASLLRRRSLFAEVAVGEPEAKAPELANRCVAAWKQLLPLHRWLVDHVQAPSALRAGG